MIEIQNLNKKFGKWQALNGINLSLQNPGCIALIGPNGCGKTTLMKSILGMVIPDYGSITVFGEDIQNKVRYRERIGYMPQIGRYPENMSIRQIFQMMRDLRQFKGKTDEELLDTWQLHDLLEKKLGGLSGGTRQKVSACLALMFKPEILLLDEPTAGLDPVSARQLINKINQVIHDGTMVIISSHLLQELDEILTELVLLQEGQLHIHQSVESLKASSGETVLSKALLQLLQPTN